MAWHTWWIYLAAVIGLSLTPGPNSLLALSHGALYGRRRTLYTIAGGITGFVLLIALSMFGIGALLQASAGALALLKWAGGAYLVWMGVQLWRSPALQLAPAGGAAPGDAASGRATPGRAASAGASRLYRQGLLAAVSNPKVLLFYGAFLPQFLDPQRALAGQFALMALTFALAECLVEYQLARLAHVVRPLLERSGRRFNQCCGALFALMGAALSFSR